jgi:hypothetical protein
MLKLTVAQRTVLRLIRETFVRVNPALGFKRQTPYRRWLARVLKETLGTPEGCIDRSHQLVGWAIFNAGNAATNAWGAPEWLQPILSDAAGSGRKYARDGGGWIWKLIEDIASHFYSVVASSEHYRERLEHPFYAISSDERLFRQEMLPIYTALLAQYKPEDWVNDLILSLSWRHLALRLLDEWEQKAPKEKEVGAVAQGA